MTREEAIAKLKECQANGRPADAHEDADEVLCLLLDSLGYADVTAEWRKGSDHWWWA